MKYVLYLILPLLILISCSESKKVATATSTKYHREIPFPKSDLINSLEWTSEPYRYPGSGSDMHWWTWGIDDAVYVLDDDGKNFGGPINYAHVLKVTGIPPNHKVETVTDFMEIPFRPRLENYDPFKGAPEPMLGHMFFTSSYSKSYGIAGIIKSTDLGKTWTNVPNANTPRFLGPKFAGLTFLNFGPGYSDVPEHLSPYVYAMSNDSSWESGDNVFMARVHKDSIINRNAWQFLSGIKNNTPSWSTSEDNSFPIFTDPGHAAHPTISYNKALKRYILGMYSDVVPHRENASSEEYSKWDKESEIQLYESEHPWGPWKIFHNEKPWGGTRHSVYLPQIPNKWWSNDGLSGTMMYAGDYTFQHKHHEYYGFMTQSFKLNLKKLSNL